jgi:hypothetical protein
VATTWIPRHTFNARRTFLLTNGETIEEPALEESGTGLKVRLTGTTKSVYRKDADKLIQRELERRASLRKTKVWMPVDTDETYLERTHGTISQQATLTMEQQAGEKANVWWKFRHPTLPIHAMVICRLKRQGALVHFSSRLIWRDTRPTVGFAPMYRNEGTNTFDDMYRALPFGDDQTFRSWAQEVEWQPAILNERSSIIERTGVEDLHAAVMAMEELDEIQIPDLRKGARRPGWLTLRLDGTNVNGQFIADLREYLDGDTTVDKVRDLYTQLVAALREVGLVLPETLKDNQLHQALAAGDSKALIINVTKGLLDDLETDTQHQVAVHLPTGTFVVQCSKSENKDQIAHAWNEAAFLAEMTGKEDELLAYARRYAQKNLEQRSKKIVAERKTKLTNN